MKKILISGVVFAVSFFGFATLTRASDATTPLSQTRVIDVLSLIVIGILFIKFFPQIKKLSKDWFNEYWGILLFIAIAAIIMVATGQ